MHTQVSPLRDRKAAYPEQHTLNLILHQQIERKGQKKEASSILCHMSVTVSPTNTENWEKMSSYSKPN